MGETNKTITLPMCGEEIILKRLQKRDLADVPEAWPIFKVALMMILATRDDEVSRMRTAEIRKDIEKMAERDGVIQTALLSRACTPAIWNTDTLGDLPDGARDMREFVEHDLEFAVGELINFVSGWDEIAARSEARRIAGFRDDSTSGDTVEAVAPNGSETQ